MGDLFFKSFKWFIFVSFFIGAVAALYRVQTHGANWLLPAVGSFGLMYMMSGTWRSLSPKAMFFSIVLVFILGISAIILPDVVYILIGKTYGVNFFLRWTGLTFVAGVPVMMFIYKAYGE